MAIKLYVWLAFLITFQASAMDTAPINKLICPFARMPIEILNHIGQFLMESDEEFIERTLDHYEQGIITFKFEKPYAYRCLQPDAQELLIGYCYDESKMAVIQLFACYYPILTIIDLTQESLADTIKHASSEDTTCEHNYDRCIALSPRATMVATVQALPQDKPLWSNKDLCIYSINIQNIHTKKTCTFNIPHTDDNQSLVDQNDRWVNENDFCDIYRIFFNKQGSRVIVYGIKHTDQAREKLNSGIWDGSITGHHMLFSLKTGTSEDFSAASEKNRLNDYFKHKIVCKALKPAPHS